MKARGRQSSEALTVHFIWSVQPPGLYADGNCLYRRGDEVRCKRWILRTVVQGKRRDVGLGSCNEISLLVARTRARRLRKIARDGGDPFAGREQVFSTRHPELTQAVSQNFDLFRTASVGVDKVALAKLGY